MPAKHLAIIVCLVALPQAARAEAFVMTLEDLSAPAVQISPELPAAAPGLGPTETACPFADSLSAAARRLGLAPALVIAVADAETRCRHAGQRSPKGAIGLMQLMPATARRFGAADPWDIDDNIAAGTAYLAWLVDRYDGDLTRTLAAYNAGEGAVDRHGGMPPYGETRAYVARILGALGEVAPGVRIARARVEPAFVIDVFPDGEFGREETDAFSGD